MDFLCRCVRAAEKEIVEKTFNGRPQVTAIGRFSMQFWLYKLLGVSILHSTSDRDPVDHGPIKVDKIRPRVPIAQVFDLVTPRRAYRLS